MLKLKLKDFIVFMLVNVPLSAVVLYFVHSPSKVYFIALAIGLIYCDLIDKRFQYEQGYHKGYDECEQKYAGTD